MKIIIELILPAVVIVAAFAAIGHKLNKIREQNEQIERIERELEKRNIERNITSNQKKS